jgi:hypothetical protein
MYEIYSNAQHDQWRYALGKDGPRKLLTIGLNPSTATQEKSDTTVAKVEGVARRHGFNGFAMLNLYPIRSTNFNALPFDADSQAYSENLNQIESFVAAEPNPVIWAAWGENIHARNYFLTAALELFSRLGKYHPAWQHLGTLTKSGHPRHPSRLNYNWAFFELDAQSYRLSLRAKQRRNIYRH